MGKENKPSAPTDFNAIAAMTDQVNNATFKAPVSQPEPKKVVKADLQKEIKAKQAMVTNNKIVQK